MKKRGLYCLLAVYWLIAGCNPYPDMAMLDKAIPRVETPIDQIALIRTKTIDGQLKQTTLFDREGRILEEYNFGRTNSKLINQYDGPLKVRAVTYFHNDDNMPATNDVMVYSYRYDQRGRLYQEIVAGKKMEHTISYAYAPNGDTIRSISPELEGPVRDVDRWTRNGKGELVGHYRLYLSSPQNGKPDTIIRMLRRYAYTPEGQLLYAWNDGKYPHIVRYQYDRLGRLIAELHEHSIDTTAGQTSNSLKEKLERIASGPLHKRDPLNGLLTYKSPDTVRYHNEPFDPKRYLPLYIPPLD